MAGAIEQMIFFIASTGAAVGFVIVAGGVVELIGNNMDTKGTALSSDMASEISVLGVKADGTILVYAENTGREDLPLNKTILRIDGQYITDTDLSMSFVKTKTADTAWEPSEVLQLDASVSLDDGWHTIKVTNGRVESMVYDFESG